jgi:hypothetical protein
LGALGIRWVAGRVKEGRETESGQEITTEERGGNHEAAETRKTTPKPSDSLSGGMVSQN